MASPLTIGAPTEVRPENPSPPPIRERVREWAGRRRAGVRTFVLSERGIFWFVASLLVIALFVTLGFLVCKWPTSYIPLYGADAEMIIAAGAIFVVAFELDRRRRGDTGPGMATAAVGPQGGFSASVDVTASAQVVEGSREPVSAGNSDPIASETISDWERRKLAHQALLDRFLGYVIGSLAGFLPLLEFAIQSDLAGRPAFGLLLSVFFMAVGSLVTVLLSGAALVSFRQALFLERQLRIEPDQVDGRLGELGRIVRLVHSVYKWGLDQEGKRANSLADAAWMVIILLTICLDLSVFWGTITGL